MLTARYGCIVDCEHNAKGLALLGLPVDDCGPGWRIVISETDEDLPIKFARESDANRAIACLKNAGCPIDDLHGFARWCHGRRGVLKLFRTIAEGMAW